jgi:hypothetical protein
MSMLCDFFLFSEATPLNPQTFFFVPKVALGLLAVKG